MASSLLLSLRNVFQGAPAAPAVVRRDPSSAPEWDDFFESNPIPGWAYASDAQQIMARNEAARRLTDSDDERSGQADPVSAALLQALRTQPNERSYSFEAELGTPGDPARLRLTAWRSGGAAQGWMVIGEDTQVMRAALARLQENRAQLQNWLDQIQQPAWVEQQGDLPHQVMHNAQYANLPNCLKSDDSPCSAETRQLKNCTVEALPCAPRAGEYDLQNCGVWQIAQVSQAQSDGLRVNVGFGIDVTAATRAEEQAAALRLEVDRSQQQMASAVESAKEHAIQTVRQQLKAHADVMRNNVSLLQMALLRERRVATREIWGAQVSALGRLCDDLSAGNLQSPPETCSSLPVQTLDRSIAAYVELMGRQLGARGEFILALAWVEPPSSIGAQIYLFIQEALDILRQHASASRFKVSLWYENLRHFLEIQDNGKSWLCSGASESPADSLWFGNLERQAVAMGGEIEIQTRPTFAGTRIVLSLQSHGA